MKLLLPSQIARMKMNTSINAALLKSGRKAPDCKPVVKLFTPWGGSTWLLTELEQDDDTMFGLCDLNMGCPEIGYVSLKELLSSKGLMGLRVERDIHFKAEHTLSEYARDAASNGRIVA